ncbi:D-sedoheptulose 7-phosphate isomerase [bacterium]|nr:D-sedoheptulose 7-phosphate isomerase [bacterium]
MNAQSILDIYLEQLRFLLDWLKDQEGKINDCAGRIIQSLEKGGKLLLFGCGGSAADAQHIAAELVGRFKRERQPLPAVALTTNTSTLTAISNDYSFDIVFSRQVEALTKSKDVVIGISTSGKSKSVIEGIKIAKKKRAFTIAFSGGDGGQLAKEADISFVVPSYTTPIIQTMHLMIGHLFCEMIDEHFGEKK